MNSLLELRSALVALFRDPVPYQGGLGLFALITLERLNAFVGLMVGLATLVYLCLRIRREVARKRGYGRSAGSGPESGDEG